MDSTIIQEIRRIVETYPRNFSKKLTQGQRDYIEDNVDQKVKDYKFAMKVYWVLHDIHEFPKCENPDCPNRITKPILSIPQGYFEFPDRYRFCSIKCRCNSDKHWKETHSGPQKAETVQRRIATNNEKYGGNAPACSKEVVKKMMDTKEERYGDSGYNNHEQAVNTLNDRYDVDNPSQVKEFQLKKEETCLKNHGKRYMICDAEYMKKVFNDKFGVDNPMKVKKIFDKARRTCKETYDADYYFQSNEYKAKLHEINKYAHRKWILCWNDDKSNKIFRRGQVEQSELDKWEHVMEFDSRPEIAIFVFCKIENEMDVEYHPTISFAYESNGVRCVYCPDFLINGKFYEFKGEQFFKIDETTGQEVMRVPWRGKKTEEEYRRSCEREEAKHQCMLANNVIILREKDIKNLTLQTFGIGV